MPPYMPPYMMPASITMAVTGGMPNVTGSSSAMPAEGPMPGSAPMTWPSEDADQHEKQVCGRQRGREAVRQKPSVSIRRTPATGVRSRDSPSAGDVEPADEDRLDQRHGEAVVASDGRPAAAATSDGAAQA